MPALLVPPLEKEPIFVHTSRHVVAGAFLHLGIVEWLTIVVFTGLTAKSKKGYTGNPAVFRHISLIPNFQVGISEPNTTIRHSNLLAEALGTGRVRKSTTSSNMLSSTNNKYTYPWYWRISSSYRTLSAAAFSFQTSTSSLDRVLYSAEMSRAISPNEASGFSSLTRGRASIL